MWDVAIIGAGLAGITCARQLTAAGKRVCILDKSRGLGGRMATRRVNNRTRVDHGLPDWSPQTESLKALTDELLVANVIKPWVFNAYEIQQREVLTRVDRGPVYLASEGMSAIAKHLSQDFTPNVNLFFQQRAASLSYHSSGQDDGWRIRCDGGQVIAAKRCVITIPAPQAADLLNTYPEDDSLSSGLAAAIASLKAVDYSPCLTVLAGYKKHRYNEMEQLSADGDVTGWTVTDITGTSTRWIGLDSSKRDRTDGPVIVIHSKPAFAQRYIDSGDLQPAASVLLRANARKLCSWIAQPEWFQVKRWRYSQVNRPYSEAMLAVGDSLFLGGDWCSGFEESETAKNIDAAYLSGQAIAQALQTV